MILSRALVTSLVLVSSCTPRETAEPAPATIQPLPSASVTTSATASTPPVPPKQVRDDGLEIEDVRVGTGDELQPNDVAVVHYVGTLPDGTEFDSSRSRGQPFKTAIPGRVIKGWNEGLPGMRVGGLRRLVIPADLAYGNRPAGKIPAGSTLIFEIELLAIQR